MKFRIIILLTFAATFSSSVFSQKITNEGTDFWFAYPEVYDKATAVYEVHITSRTNASGTVEVPYSSGSFSVPFTITAGGVQIITLPAPDMWNSSSGVVVNKAAHIISDTLVSVFATTIHLYRSEISLVLPTRALGSKYIVSTKPSETSVNVGEFVVVGTSNSSTVNITCPVTIPSICTANVPFQVTLDSGEVYQIKATGIGSDLTGTIIEAVNGTDKFAVYSGHYFLRLLAAMHRDPIFEVEYPVSSWGKEYIVPPINNIPYTQYQVIAMSNGTKIYVNGILVDSLDQGEFYEDTLANIEVVRGSKPIKVMQFLPSSALVSPGLGLGDPAMSGIAANEQMFLDEITFIAHPGNNIGTNAVIVITRTPDTSTVQLDLTGITNWKVLPQLPSYSYREVNISTGAHILTTTGCGFLAYTYGLGPAESYYYSAGALLNPEAMDSISYINSTGNNSTICNGNNLDFSSTATGNVLNFSWDFGDGNSSSLPTPSHTYNTAGTYPISLILTYSCFTDTVLDTINIQQCCTNDTTYASQAICLGDSIYLQGIWQTYPGTYYDTLSNVSSCDSILTTALTVNPTASFYKAETICAGESTYLQNAWQTTTGTYYDTLSTVNSCDSVITTTLTVLLYTDASIIFDSIFCENDPATELQVATNGGTWSGAGITSATEGTFDPATAMVGTHVITYLIPGFCDSIGIANIRVNENPSITSSYQNDSCHLSIGAAYLDVTGGMSPYIFSWSNGADSKDLAGLRSGTYTVSVIDDNGCSASDIINIEDNMTICGGQLWLPSIFSPNNDGLNDKLYVRGVETATTFLFIIYDRWGDAVFETTNPLEGWDGTNRYKPMNTAVFAYVVSATFIDESEDKISGTISLIK